MEAIQLWDNADRFLRDHKDLSYKQIAEISGIKYGTMMNWRTKGRMPGVDEAKLMANAVGCTIEELFFNEPDPRIANEGYETRLLKNILEKAPELYHTLVLTYGYAGAMADEIKKTKEETTNRA